MLALSGPFTWLRKFLMIIWNYVQGKWEDVGHLSTTEVLCMNALLNALFCSENICLLILSVSSLLLSLLANATSS